MKRLLFVFLLTLMMLSLIPALSQPAMAAENTKSTQTISGIHMTGTKPALGVEISSLTATVTNADLESIKVYDGYTGEEITEGCFEEGMVYLIRYTLTAQEGTKFADYVMASLNNAASGYNIKTIRESETRAVYQTGLITCQKITEVKITVPLLQEGMKPQELELSIPDDVNYTIEDFKVIDLQDNTEAEELRRDRKYRLLVSLAANRGYSLNVESWTYCNQAKMKVLRETGGAYAECYIDFSLDVGSVKVQPREAFVLKEGEEIAGSTIYAFNDQVVLSQLWWTDAQKNPVTGTVKGGELYYMALKLTTIGPVGEWETPVITYGNRELIIEKIDATSLNVYIPFVGLHDIGAVQVSLQGFEEGLPVKGVTVETQENVDIDFTIKDDRGRVMTDGLLERGQIYTLKIHITPKSGYCLTPRSSLKINGKVYDLSYYKDDISLEMSLDARITIDTAKINVSGVAVGKSVTKVKLTPAKGSTFEILDARWAATDTSSNKFQKGELYQLRITLDTDDAYQFTEDTVLMIGGKKAFDIEVIASGGRIYGTVQFSFRTEVSKVSLPAMPKSIKLGDTLPENFKVSSSAKYTLEAVWLMMSTQDPVAEVFQNDCFVLTYVAIPKDGYEFTEDTVFYVGGKKVKPILVTDAFAEIMKVYNVGLTEIDRIDLTLTEPEDGAAPGEVFVPEDAPYGVAAYAWGVNNTGKLEDKGEAVEIFENYKYHFLAVEMVTMEGYIFADKVTVYINGDKYTTLESANVGLAYQTAVCFGKLGEIAKLTAPELKADGLTLRWDGVPNADKYEIYRATSKSGKYTKVATVEATTWQDNAAVGKTYYYKVKAVFTPDTTKNSGYSKVVSVVYECDAPAISVENDSNGKPKISWEKVGGAKKYTVYRASSETGKYKKLGTTTKLYYTDSKASAGNTYYYKVIANGSSGKYDSGYSNIVSCPVICGTPSVSIKIDASTGKPNLSWGKVSGAAKYAIYRQLPGEEGFTLLAEQTAATYADKTAPIDTECKYYVQALGKTEALNGAVSKVVTATSGIAKPAAKGSIDAVSGKPVLTWNAVEGAIKYEIYRSTKSSKGYTLLASVESLSYEDTSVSAGKTYYYKVKAIGAVSKSADSSYVKITGKCATPEITVEKGSSGKPTLSWEKVSGAKKYTVYRATSETGKYKKLGTTTKLTYTDSKASVGTVYYYKIVANASSSKYNSGYSNIVSCDTICAAPSVKVSLNASGKPVLSWGKVSGAVKYEIYKNGVLLTTVTNTGYTDTAANAGESCTYEVKTIYKVADYSSALSKEITVTATCATPKATGKVGENKKPVLTWGEVEGATKYVVYRSTSKSKGYTVIGESETLSYEDLTAKKGKTYYYKVVAVGENFESAQSSYVKVKSK